MASRLNSQIRTLESSAENQKKAFEIRYKGQNKEDVEFDRLVGQTRGICVLSVLAKWYCGCLSIFVGNRSAEDRWRQQYCRHTHEECDSSSAGEAHVSNEIQYERHGAARKSAKQREADQCNQQWRGALHARSSSGRSSSSDGTSRWRRTASPRSTKRFWPSRPRVALNMRRRSRN